MGIALAGVAVAGAAAAQGPDLIAENLTLSASTVRQDQTVTLSFIVTNAGDEVADPTVGRVWASPDSTIDGSGNDILLAQFTVDEVPAAESISFLGSQAIVINPSATGPAGTDVMAPGVYFIAVQLDASGVLTNELDPNNFFPVPTTLTVVEPPPPQPDLVAEQLTVAPTRIRLGDTAHVAFAVANRGNAATTTSATVEVWLSPDATFERGGNDVLAAQRTVGPLDPGAVEAFSEANGQWIAVTPNAFLPDPLAPGTYYVAVLVDVGDDVPGESNEGNTFVAAPQLVVVAPAPDLIATDLDLTNATIYQNQTAYASFRVRNDGETDAASESAVEVWVSPDAVFTRSGNDVLVDRRTVAALAVGEAQDFTEANDEWVAIVPQTLGLAPGTYRVAVIVDADNDLPGEFDEGNTFVLPQTLTVLQLAPDLIADQTALTASTVRPSGTVYFTFRVRNVGNAAAPAGTAEVWASPDATFTRGGNDVRLATRAVPLLAPGGSQSFADEAGRVAIAPASVPLPPGTYYVAVLVDVGNTAPNEINENNTFIHNVQLTVLPPAPDLVADQLAVSQTRIPELGSAYVSLRVRNVGDGSAVATMLEVWASPDPTIARSGNDVRLAARPVSPLAAGGEQCFQATDQTWLEIIPRAAGSSGTDALPPGTYYLAVVLDADHVLSNEIDPNNTFLLPETVEVVPAPLGAPDLVADRIVITSTTLPQDLTALLSMRVRNVGLAEAPITLAEVWASPDPTFERGGNDTLLRQQWIPAIPSAGEVLFNEAQANRLEIRPMAAGPSGTDTLSTGTYYVAVLLDVNRQATDEADTSNTFAAPWQLNVVPPLTRDLVAADLAASETTVPVAGGFFFSFRVRNVGQYETPISLTEVYASPDAEITGGGNDVLLYQQWTEPLAVGQSADFTQASGRWRFVRPSQVGLDGDQILPPGTYYVGVIVNVGGRVPYENATNNVQVSSQTLTITEPQPGPITGPIPAPGLRNISIKRTFDWNDTPDTLWYDFYFAPLANLPLGLNRRLIGGVTTPQRPFVGDLDGDQVARDVLVSAIEANKVYWWTNPDGTGAVWNGPNELDYYRPSCAIALNIDGDPDNSVDIVVAGFAGEGSPLGTLAYFANDQGVYNRWDISTLESQGIRVVQAADLDRDGTVDLVTGADGGNTLVFYLSRVLPTPEPTPTPEPGDGENGEEPPPDDGSTTPTQRVDFTGHRVPTDWPIYDLKLTDLDNDGWIDIVAVSLEGNRLLWYRNNGDANNLNFEETEIDASLAAPSALDVRDLNGNERTDIVVTTYFGNEVILYDNTATTETPFAKRVLLTGFNEPTTVAIADIDLNEAPDIFAASALMDRLVLLRNNGGATPSFTSTFYDHVGDRVHTIAMGDLDGDSIADIAAASSFESALLWFKVEPDLSQVPPAATDLRESRFVPPTDLAYNTFYAWQVVAKSLNEQRRGPVWVFKTQPVRAVPTVSVDPVTIEQGGVTVLRFQATNPSPNTIGPQRPALVNGGWRASVYASANDVYEPGVDLLLRTFDITSTIPPGGTSNLLTGTVFSNAVGDNRDQALAEGVYRLITVIDPQQKFTYQPYRDDIFVSENVLVIAKKPDVPAGPNPPDGATGVNIGTSLSWGRVNHATSYTVLLTEPTLITSDERFTERTVYNAATQAAGVTTADLDGDGDRDVIAIYGGANGRLDWFRNNGARPPSFERRAIASGLAAPSSVAAGDVNGDGLLDILVGNAGDGTILCFENNGQNPPGFIRRTIAEGADNVAQVVAGDLNLDGRTDVVSASFFGSLLAWHEFFWNTAQPRFVTHPIDTTSGKASAVTLADMNNDGLPDLVAAFWDVGPVVWYENDAQAPGTFIRHEIAATGREVSSIAAADFNRDGRMDVVVTSRQDHRVLLFENQGGSPPSFAQRTLVSNAYGAQTCAAGDVDRDGWPDLVVGSAFDDTVRWFVNDARTPLSFSQRIVTTAADFVRSVTIAELDGAGNQEIVVASAADGRIRTFEFSRSVTQGPPRVRVMTIPQMVDPPSTVQPDPPLVPGFQYTWQVIAGNFTFRTLGPVWRFTTGQADLIARDLSLNPSTIALGGSFQVRFSVQNTGTGQTPPTHARVFASTDEFVTGLGNDVLLGDVAIDALDPNQLTSFTLTVDSRATGAGGTTALGTGAYYIAVLVDADNADPNEANEINTFYVQPRLLIRPPNASGGAWIRYE